MDPLQGRCAHSAVMLQVVMKSAQRVPRLMGGFVSPTHAPFAERRHVNEERGLRRPPRAPHAPRARAILRGIGRGGM